MRHNHLKNPDKIERLLLWSLDLVGALFLVYVVALIHAGVTS